MSRAEAFKQKLESHGSEVTLVMKPTTLSANKCSCWEHGWPDPNCKTCDGSGYKTSPSNIEVKAFVLPVTAADKILHASMGDISIGSVNCFLSPDVSLDDVQEILWDGLTYRVTNVDRVAIEEEIIYRQCLLQRIDEN